MNATVNANVDIGFVAGTLTFATPVLGGQASASLLRAYGANATSLAGSLRGTITTTGGTFPFSRFDTINSSIIALGDLVGEFALRWNPGVNNYVTYITADLPVGPTIQCDLQNNFINPSLLPVAGGRRRPAVRGIST